MLPPRGTNPGSKVGGVSGRFSFCSRCTLRMNATQLWRRRHAARGRAGLQSPALTCTHCGDRSGPGLSRRCGTRCGAGRCSARELLRAPGCPAAPQPAPSPRPAPRASTPPRARPTLVPAPVSARAPWHPGKCRRRALSARLRSAASRRADYKYGRAPRRAGVETQDPAVADLASCDLHGLAGLCGPRLSGAPSRWDSGGTALGRASFEKCLLSERRFVPSSFFAGLQRGKPRQARAGRGRDQLTFWGEAWTAGLVCCTSASPSTLAACHPHPAGAWALSLGSAPKGPRSDQLPI